MGKYRVRPGRLIPALFVLLGGIGLILWGAFSTLAWAKNNVLLHLLDITVLVQDEVRETLTTQGLLIKHEEPVKAPVSGQLHLLVQDGDRLRTGALMAQISGTSNEKIWSPRSGIFCTHLDNLENMLVPDMIDVLDLAAVEKISDNITPTADEVTGGQIIGKVVDNLQPMLVLIRLENPDEHVTRSFSKDAAVTLLWNDEKLNGKITQIHSAEGVLNMLVELSQYPEEYIHQRRVELDLVTRWMAGWLVPEEAIIFKEGKPGIYIVSKQTVRWIPVAVQDRLQGMVAVSGEKLNNSVRFVKNPGWAREGVRLD